MPDPVRGRFVRAARRVFAPLTTHWSERRLTALERSLSPAPMASAVDLDRVRIVNRFHNPAAAALAMTVVRGDRVYWAGAPDEATTPEDRAHLAHELVHVWQYKALGRGGLEILMDRRYRYALRPGAAFAGFGYEQQAAIVEDQMRLACGLGARWALGPAAATADYAATIATCAECLRLRPAKTARLPRTL